MLTSKLLTLYLELINARKTTIVAKAVVEKIKRAIEKAIRIKLVKDTRALAK